MDLRLPIAFRGELLAGRALYEEVIRDGVLAARRSVWIATANVKELWVEPRGLRRRGKKGGDYVSILEPLDDLAARGVELRMLYAEIPSRRFRAAFDRRARLVKGGLALKQCPRLHMKAVIIDGERLYLGSANLTGAGLGAKGTDTRNFELGLVTDDCHLVDRVQGLFDALWRGEPCGSCRLRDVCPDPGPYDRRAADR
jgi:phosphatidylserine/phosphatidylglycerophosphate/cardiolipin synthase-like enzyme